jgi:mannan endo-1,4-beta-mannosidase
MPEHHGAGGDLTKVPSSVDYWVKSDVLSVLLKYQDKLLLNIANESGGSNVAAATFESTYKTAISRLRTAGYTCPLVIDGSQWGQDLDRLVGSAPVLTAADPLHNILYSVHTYWQDASGSQVKSRLPAAIQTGIPLIVGEFADVMVGACTPGAFNVVALMQVAKEQEIGWLPWSWGAVTNSDCPGQFEMSDGTFAGLKGWGLTVATTDPNSIKNTSVISPYMAKGSCN